MDKGKMIRINRLKAIKTVEENLEKHRKEYAEQIADYRSAYMVWAKKNLASLEAGTSLEKMEKELYFNLPFPHNHEKDYQEALDILNWSVSDDSTSIAESDQTIVIDRSEFDSWIRNQWHWRRDFALNTTIYKAANSVFSR